MRLNLSLSLFSPSLSLSHKHIYTLAPFTPYPLSVIESQFPLSLTFNPYSPLHFFISYCNRLSLYLNTPLFQTANDLNIKRWKQETLNSHNISYFPQASATDFLCKWVTICNCTQESLHDNTPSLHLAELMLRSLRSKFKRNVDSKIACRRYSNLFLLLFLVATFGPIHPKPLSCNCLQISDECHKVPSCSSLFSKVFLQLQKSKIQVTRCIL